MGKPRHAVYQRFTEKYQALNREFGLKQYLVPYLMSSHPGSTMKDAAALAEFCRDMGYMPEQVQDFYPTPSTISTVMYATGLDPRTMAPVYVPRDPNEKAMQRALIQYKNPKNYKLVREALILAHREDLIGFGPKCLIRPDGPSRAEKPSAPPPRSRSSQSRKKNPADGPSAVGFVEIWLFSQKAFTNLNDFGILNDGICPYGP